MSRGAGQRQAGLGGHGTLVCIQPLTAAMSWPRAPGPKEDAPETLLEDLISFYLEGAGEGRLRVCRQATLTSRAQQLLDTGPPLQLYLPEEVAPDSGAPCFAQHIDHKLVRALEFLELVSIHLLLFPWRKEIRSLKVSVATTLGERVLGRGQGPALGLGRKQCVCHAH